MNHFFNSGSSWYPFRWFIVIATGLTLWMSYTDYSGGRVFTYSGNQQRGYYGGPTGHK
ncbi:MAG TPA: hypothetical protein VNS58_19450 [Puia sp.]|jgi:hypothetical protein|nr:hypothetical protein [Puia sp.]